MSDNVKTPEFRMSFVNVFQPRATNPDGTGEKKYSLVMLFPKGADLSALKADVARVSKEKWGDKIPKGLRNPLKEVDPEERDEYQPGMVRVSATSKQKPGLVDAKVQPIIDESEIYSGCWGRASVRAFAYDVNGNRGVSFGLQNLQKTRDDAPFGNRARPENEFEAVGESAGGEGGGIFD